MIPKACEPCSPSSKRLSSWMLKFSIVPALPHHFSICFRRPLLLGRMHSTFRSKSCLSPKIILLLLYFDIGNHGMSFEVTRFYPGMCDFAPRTRWTQHACLHRSSLSIAQSSLLYAPLRLDSPCVRMLRGVSFRGQEVYEQCGHFGDEFFGLLNALWHF